MRDVGFIRYVALVGIEREKTRGFKQLQRTAAVGQIRRNGNLVAVLDVGNRLDLLLVVEDAKRRHKRVADGDDLVAVALDVIGKICLVLEGIEINFLI